MGVALVSKYFECLYNLQLSISPVGLVDMVVVGRTRVSEDNSDIYM